jgi:hypothetical protein
LCEALLDAFPTVDAFKVVVADPLHGITARRGW